MQTGESIFSHSEMLRSRGPVVPTSSPAVGLVHYQDFRCTMPRRNLLGGFKWGEKKKEKIMHNKGAEENHGPNLSWGYICIRSREGVLGPE